MKVRRPRLDRTGLRRTATDMAGRIAAFWRCITDPNGLERTRSVGV